MGAPRVVDVPADAQAANPVLAARWDGTEAWVVYAVDAAGPLRHLSRPLYAAKFDTSSWPAGPIGPSTLLDTPPVTSFAVAGSRHFAGNEFDLVYSGDTPESLLVAPMYAVGYGAGWGTAPVGNGWKPRALFASTYAFTLIGYRIRETMDTSFERSSVRMARGQSSRFGVTLFGDRLLGCVDSASPAAAATVSGQDWILAYADGVVPPGAPSPGVDSCALAGEVGPPLTLRIARLVYSAPDVDVGHVLTTPLPITMVAAAPRSDGAWVVFGQGSSGIEALRVDPQAKPLLAPVDVSGGGVAQLRGLSASHIGDDLVAAWGDSDAGALIVARVDEGGHIVQTVSIPVDGSIDQTSVLDLEEHPTDGFPPPKEHPVGVVVAWSSTQGAQQGPAVRVALMACAP